MPLKLSSNINLDKVVRNMGQKMLLAPHIDLALADAGEFEWDAHFTPKLPDDAWHPSGDCTPSLRELYLKASGQLAERTFPVSLRKTFMVGHFWHQYLQWVVEHQLAFCDASCIERRGIRHWGGHDMIDGKIHPLPYHWATGAGDVAPCTIPGAGDFAIDFKTMNARMFTTGPTPDYLDKWECQGNIYLDFFDLERIIFVGICKDSPHDMKEWIFERNQPLIDAIYLKWHVVSECLDEGVEPPEDEDIWLPVKGPVTTK